ncbi:hypothetical protein AB9K41_30670 [Cribrihabitans sp. XS_ASV171]
MADPNDIRAPSSVVYAGKAAGKVSFSTYFLRDLFSKGRIDEALISRILSENGFSDEDAKAVLQVVTATGEPTIPASRALALDSLAEAIAAHN